VTLPLWQHALPFPPLGGRLEQAWMTTFERPDAALLVEHLLPSLLGMSTGLSQDSGGRNVFFSELGTTLEPLRNRFTIISSPTPGERVGSPYPWLWRYLDRFTVGAKAHAVQHAKLWAFHWSTPNEDLLELHLTSTNLTWSAFKNQLQAGWRIILPLGDRPTQATRRTWGALVPFIVAMGDAAGPLAATRLSRLVTLLGRSECPTDVEFVTSVPGKKNAGRQLRAFEASEVHVLTPTVGDWNDRTVKAWCDDIGVSPRKVRIKWISERHPWAATSGWAMSKAASEALLRCGVQLECLPEQARLTDEHRSGDPRWSHAKLYVLRRGRQWWLLVTSANWSASAWGAGRDGPRNFELGVIFRSEWTSLRGICVPFDPPNSVPFCVDRDDTDEPLSPLQWAEATWDGSQINLCARSTDSVTPVSVDVTFVGGLTQSIAVVEGKASMPWKDPKLPPSAARFAQGSDVLDVDVVDLRMPPEFRKTPLPEVDPGLEQKLREAFLLQRYGGPVVEPEAIPRLNGERELSGSGAPASDYAVQAWVDARAGFAIVDNWRCALGDSAADADRAEQIRMDGEDLRNWFARRSGPAAALVTEELSWRLRGEA